MPTRIKRVGMSDKKDILEISRHTWEGHDYLPSVIDEWLEDSASYVYGVEESERLVAVANLRLADGGRTGWMEGLRVHPDFRVKGYAHALTQELIEKAKELGVMRLRYTTSTENEASLKLAEKYGFARVFEMSVFWRPNPKAALPGATHHSTRASSSSEVYASVQANPHLIPCKVLVFDWKALDCTLEGLEMLGKSHEFYVSPEKGEVNSLSYGTLRRRGEILLWVFTIHAISPRRFLSHLYRNTASALERGCNAIMGTYDVKFERVFQKVDWGSEERWGTHLVLLERTLGNT